MNHHEAALDMLKRALEMERGGKEFYDKAATACTNPLGKEIFTGLAADEVVHEERIKAIYRSLSEGNAWSDEWRKWETKNHDMAGLFGDFAKAHRETLQANASDIQALDVGMDLELKSVKYYGEHLKRAADPMEKAFLEKMIEEERSHHALLADTKLYLSNPEAWYAEREHVGLDGG